MLLSGASLSGHELDRTFVQDAAGRYHDVTGVSGLDSDADGRSFAWLDFDRDGRMDIAKVNANAPLLQLFRNEIEGSGGVVAIRLLGQGVGAHIEGTANGVRLVRQTHAGEGFAAQNSATVLIGLGPATALTDAIVRWPGGREHALGDLARGELITVSPGGAVEREAWIRQNRSR